MKFKTQETRAEKAPTKMLIYGTLEKAFFMKIFVITANCICKNQWVYLEV